MTSYRKLGCPKCSLNKDSSVRSYGSFIVYENDTTLKLKCKSCTHIMRFRYIRGGVIDEDD